MNSALFRHVTAPLVALLATGLFLGGCASTRQAVVDPALLDPARNSAVNPVPRDPKWMARHEGFVDIAKKGGVDVLFLGDSITDGWRNDTARGGKKTWDREYAPLRAANFGISGDRTQHVLWRLDNGEAVGIQPKAVVVMIGTNNTGFETDKVTPRNTPAGTVAGVAAILKSLQTKFPKTKVLLLAVFPRGEKPDHPQRLQVNEINRGLVRLADGKSIRYLDIGPKFLQPDGTMSKDIMPDFLHPGAAGYEIWAAAIKQPLLDLLK